MSTSVGAILDLYRQRRTQYNGLHNSMRVVQRAYNNQMDVPLPDMDRVTAPSVPNLLVQGIDQMAGRITSIVPSVTFSSTNPGVRKYDRMAMTAAKTIEGWWQMDRLQMKMKQRGRHLIAYAMSPVVIRWNHKEHRPIWQVRHPLETFPSTDLVAGQVTPTNVIFAFRRSVAWCRAQGYGNQIAALLNSPNVSMDATILLLEYVDAAETVLVAVGYRANDSLVPDDYIGEGMRGIELERYANFSDRCPAIVPARITLDTLSGQFDGMVGMYARQARLMALEEIAVEKGIFPDVYIESRPGEQGRFVQGPFDGRSGDINIIAGGTIREIQSQPGYMTNPMIDRMERAQRVTAGLPAEFGGESGSNIRTGRRGDAVLSAVIDFPIAEAQEAFGYALEEENEVAIGLAKQFDGSTPRTIYVGTGNSQRPVTYTPEETFKNAKHTVTYPASGSDINNLIIGIGQRVGLGIMSKRTAAVLDPWINNPEIEHDTIIAEGLEQALVSGIQQQAATGQIPPLVVAQIMKLVKDDKMEIAEAMAQVTQKAMEQQQAQQQADAAAQPQTPDALSAGPAAQALAGAQIEPPAQSMPSVHNLGQMLMALRRPATAGRPVA